jgi:hypothetical protein
MRFTPDDPFQLTPKVSAQLPMPGAADVAVRDLLYCQEPSGALRYLFTVEYTIGVLRTKRRRVSVGMLVEEGVRTVPIEPFSGVTLAPEDLPLEEQYQWLRQQGGEGVCQTPAAEAVPQAR